MRASAAKRGGRLGSVAGETEPELVRPELTADVRRRARVDRCVGEQRAELHCGRGAIAGQVREERACPRRRWSGGRGCDRDVAASVVELVELELDPRELERALRDALGVR